MPSAHNVTITTNYNDSNVGFTNVYGTWYFCKKDNINADNSISRGSSYDYDENFVDIINQRPEIISFIEEKRDFYNVIDASLRTQLDQLLNQTSDYLSLLHKCGTSELATLNADLSSTFEDVRYAIYGISKNLKPAKEALQNQMSHCHDYDADANYFNEKKLSEATSRAEAALNGYDVSYINDCTTTLRDMLSSIEAEIATNKAKEQEVRQLFEEGATMRDSISQYLTMINSQDVIFGLYAGTNGSYIYDYYPEFLKLHFAGNVYAGDSRMNSLSDAFNAMYQNFQGNGSATVSRYDNREEADRTNLCLYDYADTLSGFISWGKEEFDRSHEKFSSYCSELHDIIRRVEACLADKNFTHIADSLQTNLRNYYYEINRVNFSSYGYVAYILYKHNVKDARNKLLSDVEAALENYKNETTQIAPLQALIDKSRLLQADEYAELYATVSENDRSSFDEAIRKAQTCVDKADVENISTIQAALQQVYYTVYGTMYAALNQQCNGWVAKAERLKVDYADVYDLLSEEDALKLSNALADVKKADNFENLYQVMQQLIVAYNELSAKLEALRTTTAIVNIKEFDSTTRIYDLNGRRVVAKDKRLLKPGAYIVNGRKVIVK